jgi:hypothetical protein
VQVSAQDGITSGNANAPVFEAFAPDCRQIELRRRREQDAIDALLAVTRFRILDRLLPHPGLIHRDARNSVMRHQFVEDLVLFCERCPAQLADLSSHQQAPDIFQHPCNPQVLACADIDASRAMRPFIYQLRREYTSTRMTAMTDEHVFTQREFRYGVDGRDNIGTGFWQLAYASNQDLSVPANYDAARAAMRAIKTDGGLPFGAWSNRKGRFLVVPASLEGTARRLLHSEQYAAAVGGATLAPISNIWLNDADLIVSEYLD